ncbi:MAG: amidohydrolase family protein, partial [Acidobacteria bacterium]|nr:amidohydrolase family protein [Acidobacteriota bacterium]
AGARATTAVPEGAEIVDASGKTLIPGLIDLHSHYMTASGPELDRQLGVQLAWGVTTARSIGVDNPEHVEQLRSVRERGIPAPRLLTAGLGFSHPQGHPLNLTQIYRPEGPVEAQRQVLALAHERVDFVKMWVDSKYGTIPKISKEVRDAITDAAAQHGIPVVAHIFDEEDVYHLAVREVSDFLHTVRDREPMDAKFLELCKARNLSFTPTLTVIESNWLLMERPELLLDDPQVRAAASAEAAAQVADPDWRKQRLAETRLDILKPELGRAQRFAKQMAEEGVWLGLGSDSNGATIPHGWGAHNEMRLLAEAGVAPLAVLSIATEASAGRLGGYGADIGTLEVGKQADLVLLDADPLADIRNTRKIARVMQAGRWVDREALLQAE